MLDGANGVSGAPRQHFPDAAVAGGVAGLAFVLTVLLLRKRTSWIFAVMLLGAVPGAWLVLGARADAPLQRAALAVAVEGTISQIETAAPWPGTKVVREDDDVLFPLTRYAVPTRGDTSGVELEVRGSSLSAQCREEAGRKICGAGL